MAHPLPTAVRESPREIDTTIERIPESCTPDDAARVLGTEHSRVLVFLDRGAFPNAFRVDGDWRIPLRDIRRLQLARATRSPAALVRTRRPYDALRTPPAWMTPAERRKFIAQLLAKQRSVRISALSAELGVSQVTIRRDLARLEADGRLIRSYGGAMAPDTHAIADRLPASTRVREPGV